MAYTDYSEGLTVDKVIKWSGWNNEDLYKEASRLRPIGGGDVPEACKTALVESLKYVDPERRTLILWYADAGPHHSSNGRGYYSNRQKEIAALEGQETDWVKLSKKAKQSNCTIFPILEQGMAQASVRFFALISAFTNGMVFTTPARTSAEISQLTLDLLLSWMGESISPPKYSTEVIAFKRNPTQASLSVEDEEDGSRGYLPANKQGTKLEALDITRIRSLDEVQFDVVTTLPNLSKKFLDPEEKAYRNKVHNALRHIINYNVVALTYNAVFGQVCPLWLSVSTSNYPIQLWRAVCKDRNDPHRDELVDAFSNQVGKEKDQNRRQMLTEWLEESYNSEAEIQEMIDSAPDAGDPNQRRIYLDLDSGVNLTRVELLEVARSLYPGVLQKLASILTHLKVLLTSI